jgi:uncharacterized membrane protein
VSLPELAPPHADTPLRLAPGDMIREGWIFIKPHLAVVIVVGVVSAVIAFVLHHVPLAGVALSFVWQIVVGSGLYNYLWRAGRGETASVADLFTPIQDKAGGVIVVSLLTLIAIIIGVVFLIIPGLYVAVALSLALPLVTLTTLGAADAMALSWHIINRHLVDFIVLALVVMAMNFAGALLFGLGLFVTLPITFGIQLVVLTQLLLPASVQREPG